MTTTSSAPYGQFAQAVYELGSISQVAKLVRCGKRTIGTWRTGTVAPQVRYVARLPVTVRAALERDIQRLQETQPCSA